MIIVLQSHVIIIPQDTMRIVSMYHSLNFNSKTTLRHMRTMPLAIIVCNTLQMHYMQIERALLPDDFIGFLYPTETREPVRGL
eukprot:scaffold652893_cov123-Prasinocladus_malaysianus.AAC.1